MGSVLEHKPLNAARECGITFFSNTLFSKKDAFRSRESGFSGLTTYLNLPLKIKPSPDELWDSRLVLRNLEKAISLHADGVVVTEDAIPCKDLDHLNAKMLQDALHLQHCGSGCGELFSERVFDGCDHGQVE
jgi:hypothetical protein